MSAIDSMASVASAGIDDAAARSKAPLKEPRRVLPEMPMSVTRIGSFMSGSSRGEPPPLHADPMILPHGLRRNRAESVEDPHPRMSALRIDHGQGCKCGAEHTEPGRRWPGPA